MSSKPENTFISSVREVWKPYPSDPRFSVSSLGRVRFKNKPPKTIEPRSNGYFYICAYRDGCRIAYSVASMVLETFVGPRPQRYTASHLNGKPGDNRHSNLAWESHSANCMRKRDHGTAQNGERNPMAKLSDADVISICKSPLSSRKIAPLFNVSDVHIRRLRRQRAQA